VADEHDDLLNPGEIDGLLDPDGSGQSASSPVTPTTNPESGAAAESSLDDDLRQPDVAEQLLSQAEADLEAAIAPQLGADRSFQEAAETATAYEFQQFDDPSRNDGSNVDVDAIRDVELDLCIELGRTELLIEEVLKLKEGSVVPLDKLAGDPVDIVVNGRLIARGEVLVLNDSFCVRVAEILTPGT